MAMLIVAVWAFAEAALFFIVADVPISAIGLKRGWRAAALAAMVATLAAAAGGLLLMAAANAWPEGTSELVSRVPGISTTMMDRAAAEHAAGGWTAMLHGAFSGVPYKLYVLAAAGKGTGLLPFVLASIAARLPRFLLVAAISSALGAVLRPRLSSRMVTAAHLVFWILFYAAYFAATGI